MAQRVKFKLDRAGVAEILKSNEARALCREAAEKIAEDARSGLRPDIADTVAVSEYTSDRAGCSVTICHPSGLGMQAKYGTLTRAAAAVGLEVRSR